VAVNSSPAIACSKNASSKGFEFVIAVHNTYQGCSRSRARIDHARAPKSKPTHHREEGRSETISFPLPMSGLTLCEEVLTLEDVLRSAYR